MIILTKKKLLYSIVIITIFVFTYIVTAYNVTNSNKNNNFDIETVQTVALPVDKKVIIIDARTSENQMKGQKVAQAQQKLRVT